MSVTQTTSLSRLAVICSPLLGWAAYESLPAFPVIIMSSLTLILSCLPATAPQVFYGLPTGFSIDLNNKIVILLDIQIRELLTVDRIVKSFNVI